MACTTVAPAAFEPLEVRVVALDVAEKGGVLQVQTIKMPDASVELPQVEVEGLTFVVEDEVVERLGDRVVVTQRYRFTGKKGSYEIGALTATAGEDSATSLPVWVDMGVEVEEAAVVEDIDDPAEIVVIPWGWIGGGVALVVALCSMIVVAFVGALRRPSKPKPRRAPDIRCLEAWDRVRSTDMDDEEKARQLSWLFRVYSEEVLHFAAESSTTSEILEHLGGLNHLPEGNVLRAKRLLRATDRVKFADMEPGQDFFEQLDSDLRAFVASTRPQTWSEEG